MMTSTALIESQAQAVTSLMKRVMIRTEEELDQHMDAVNRLNGELNSCVFTDATLLRYAFRDAMKKEQSPFIIAIYDHRGNLQALIPLYHSRGKKLQILWDKTSDYVDVLATENALCEVKAEFDDLLRRGYALCFNKTRSDARLCRIAEGFRAPLQRITREKLEHAWAISKAHELPRLNTKDVKRRKSQLRKRGVKVEHVGKDCSHKKICESVLETVYLKYTEFARRNKPYELCLAPDAFIELISSLVKEDKAFIVKTVSPSSAVDAAILFFKDAATIYSIMPAYNSHAPHSPGLSLMYHTIEDFFASENGPLIYDFTIGDEPYKQRFSNRKTQLRTIYVSNRIAGRLSHFFIYRSLDCVKSIPAINRLKITLMDKFATARFVTSRFVAKLIDYTSAGLPSAVRRYLSSRTSTVLLLKRERGGAQPASESDCGRCVFSAVSFPDLINFYSRNFPNRYEMWDKVDVSMYRMANDFVPYGLFLGGGLVSLAWVQCSGKYVVGEKGVALDLQEDECAILDVMTDHENRRKGLYSLLQRMLLTTNEVRNKRIILHTTSDNVPSINAHKKLGYLELKRVS